MSIGSRDVPKLMVGGSLLLGGGTLGLLAAHSAGAATITVTSAADSGAGSLREAIANAAPGDTISFASGISSITVTSKLWIDKSLTISGPGSGNLAISGGGTVDQVLYIFAPSSTTDVTIAGMTITGATHTGINDFGENLTLDGVVVTGNGGPTNEKPGFDFIGTYGGSSASLHITNSSFTNNQGRRGGGALLEVGDTNVVTISGTSFQGNTARDLNAKPGYGAGLAILAQGSNPSGSTGSVTISDSDIVGNTIVATGGTYGALSIKNDAVSGPPTTVDVVLDRVSVANTVGASGIDAHAGGSLTVSSSTISGNAGPGIDAIPGGPGLTVAVAHSTIANNTGWAIGTSTTRPQVDLDHVLVAGNHNGGFDLYDGANFRSVNFSLVHRLYQGTLTGTGNVVGIDPGLLPAALVAPHVIIVPFSNTSAAFNAGDATFAPPPNVDQTGRPRVANGRIDIGAYEYQSGAPIPSSTTSTSSTTTISTTTTTSTSTTSSTPSTTTTLDPTTASSIEPTTTVAGEPVAPQFTG